MSLGNSSPVRNLQNQTPSRPSFLSPTRASLSRFNPSLLPRPRSTVASHARQTSRPAEPMSDSRSEMLARGEAALNFIMGGINSEMRPAADEGGITGEETDEQMEAMRSENAIRRESERMDSEGFASERGESQGPESVHQSLPPSETGRGQSQLPESFVEDTLPYEEEDDLPETPEALRRQIEVEDAPPRGILFSSPSKRPRNRNRFKEPVPVPDVQATVTISNSAREEDPQPKQPIRQNAPKDPELVAKEEEKAKLQKELDQLREEVGRYETLIEEFENLEDDQDPSNMQDLV
jgi:hypothetical protein